MDERITALEEGGGGYEEISFVSLTTYGTGSADYVKFYHDSTNKKIKLAINCTDTSLYLGNTEGVTGRTDLAYENYPYSIVYTPSGKIVINSVSVGSSPAYTSTMYLTSDGRILIEAFCDTYSYRGNCGALKTYLFNGEYEIPVSS